LDTYGKREEIPFFGVSKLLDLLMIGASKKG